MGAGGATVKVVGPRGSGIELVSLDLLAGSLTARWVENYGVPLTDVWLLRLELGNRALQPFESLASQGVVDGSVVRVEALRRARTASLSGATGDDERFALLLERSLALLPELPAPWLRFVDPLRRLAFRAPSPIGRGRGAEAGVRRGRPRGSARFVARLDAAIGAGQLRRSGVVAVVATRSGVGTTTVAKMFAGALAARRRERVVLAEMGFVVAGVDPGGPTPAPEWVDALLERGPDGVHAVVAPLPGGTPVTAASLLREHVGIVVLDLAADPYDRATADLLRIADHIVVVTDMDPMSDLETAQALRDLGSLGRATTVAVNRVPPTATATALAHVVGLAGVDQSTTVAAVFEVDRSTGATSGAADELAAMVIRRWSSAEEGLVSPES